MLVVDQAFKGCQINNSAFHILHSNHILHFEPAGGNRSQDGGESPQYMPTCIIMFMRLMVVCDYECVATTCTWAWTACSCFSRLRRASSSSSCCSSKVLFSSSSWRTRLPRFSFWRVSSCSSSYTQEYQETLGKWGDVVMLGVIINQTTFWITRNLVKSCIVLHFMHLLHWRLGGYVAQLDNAYIYRVILYQVIFGFILTWRVILMQSVVPECLAVGFPGCQRPWPFWCPSSLLPPTRRTHCRAPSNKTRHDMKP